MQEKLVKNFFVMMLQIQKKITICGPPFEIFFFPQLKNITLFRKRGPTA